MKVPQNGCLQFTMENPLKWMITRGTPMLGNRNSCCTCAIIIDDLLPSGKLT